MLYTSNKTECFSYEGGSQCGIHISRQLKKCWHHRYKNLDSYIIDNIYSGMEYILSML